MISVAPPRAAILLGYTGLLPAAACCLALLVGPTAWRAAALHLHALYAASILSFIGGTWWGLASARSPADRLPFVLGASVLPSLAGWAVAAVGGAAAMLGLALLFAAVLPFDARLIRTGVAPPWWLALRRPLSIGMALLAAVAATTL